MLADMMPGGRSTVAQRSPSPPDARITLSHETFGFWRTSGLRTYNIVASQIPCHIPAFLTCDDASRLTRCHRALVSNSCHFLRTPPPVRGRPTQSLQDPDNPAQNVPSRDAYQVHCANGRPRSGRLTYHLLSSVAASCTAAQCITRLAGERYCGQAMAVRYRGLVLGTSMKVAVVRIRTRSSASTTEHSVLSNLRPPCTRLASAMSGPALGCR